MSAHPEAVLALAHALSLWNRPRLVRGQGAGCFDCLAVLAPAEIVEWVDEGSTALCPRCGNDTLLPDRPPWLVEHDVLRAMRRRWCASAANEVE